MIPPHPELKSLSLVERAQAPMLPAHPALSLPPKKWDWDPGVWALTSACLLHSHRNGSVVVTHNVTFAPALSLTPGPILQNLTAQLVAELNRTQASQGDCQENNSEHTPNPGFHHGCGGQNMEGGTGSLEFWVPFLVLGLWACYLLWWTLRQPEHV